MVNNQNVVDTSLHLTCALIENNQNRLAYIDLKRTTVPQDRLKIAHPALLLQPLREKLVTEVKILTPAEPAFSTHKINPSI
jgi:hypothetical protein